MSVSTKVPPVTGGVGAHFIAADVHDDPVTKQRAEPPSKRRDLDDGIIAAFCAGDEAALGYVFDHYSRAVWAVAMKVLDHRQLAEDATQETFVRAWRSADRFDPRRPMAPWLFTIARRTALDVHRSEFRPTRGAHAEEQEVAVSLPGIERAWETWEIKLALDQLPEEERDVMKLAHFHGMSHPQIAAHLDIPLGTVKSRSFRAHKRLAMLLAHLIEPKGGVA